MPVTWDTTFISEYNGVSFSSGDLVATHTVDDGFVRATQSHFSGKHYFEVEMIVYGYNSSYENVGYIGLVEEDALPDYYSFYPFRWLRVAGSPYAVKAADSEGGEYSDWYSHPTLVDGSVIRVAVDFDAGKVWFGINNTWGDDNLGDPAAGSNPTMSPTLGIYFPGLRMPGYGASWRGRFASGDFLYSVPSGFSAWDDVVTSFSIGTATSEVGILASGSLHYDLDSLTNRILHHLLTNGRWIKATTLSLGLLTSMEPVVEVSTIGYQRIDFAPSDANFSILDGVLTSSIDFQFPSLTETLVGWCLFSNVYGSTPLVKKAFSSPIICSVLEPGPIFPAGQLHITFI